MNIGFMNLNGKRYIVPHWIEVGETVTYDNIMDYISKDSVIPEPKIETYSVAGKPYTIAVVDGKISCSCPGFKFHKKCKHITEFKMR